MTHELTAHRFMTRTLTTTLLLAGLVVTAAAAEQPNTLSHPAAPGYFYIAGRAYLGVDHLLGNARFEVMGTAVRKAK